jgi:hypothetical protein
MGAPSMEWSLSAAVMIDWNVNESTQSLRNVAELVGLLPSRLLDTITFILQGKLAAPQEFFLRIGTKAWDHLTRRREAPGKKTDCRFLSD